MARNKESEPTQPESNLSADEQKRLVELLQREMTVDEIAAALSHRRGVTVPKWEVERAISQLKAETEKANAVQLDRLFADPDLDTEPAPDEDNTAEEEEKQS